LAKQINKNTKDCNANYLKKLITKKPLQMLRFVENGEYVDEDEAFYDYQCEPSYQAKKRKRAQQPQK